MKIQQIILVLLVAVFSFSACKTETKKEPEVKISATPKMQKASFDISGMTCEIGCAKTIQSKLSKKAGITAAKVIFKDSIGFVEYDANTISIEEITKFVDGIAGGDLYKTSNVKTVSSFEETAK